MYWRLDGPAFSAGKGAGNRDAFRALVTSGHARGVLAWAPDDPGTAVGWCAVGPRDDYGRILRSRALQRSGGVEAVEGGGPRSARSGSDVEAGSPRAGASVWSLNCFYIPASRRRQGVARALLDGAVQLAFASGATEVEAYPVVPATPGKDVPATFAWTGPVGMFEAAGFRRVASSGKRPVVALARPASG
jgi:GNAT superfamily N-acetyltransferase